MDIRLGRQAARQLSNKTLCGDACGSRLFSRPQLICSRCHDRLNVGACCLKYEAGTNLRGRQEGQWRLVHIQDSPGESGLQSVLSLPLALHSACPPEPAWGCKTWFSSWPCAFQMGNPQQEMQLLYAFVSWRMR